MKWSEQVIPAYEKIEERGGHVRRVQMRPEVLDSLRKAVMDGHLWGAVVEVVPDLPEPFILHQ